MKKYFLLFLFSIFIVTGCKTNNNNNEVDKKIEHKIDLYYDKAIQDTFYVENDKYFNEPQSPIKEGFSFEGWYVDYACTSKYDFNLPVVSSMTLYAKFLEIFTVTFDEFGSVDVVDGNTVDVPNNPTKDNHTFLGWFLNDDIFDFNTIIDKDIHLIAKWEENKVLTHSVFFGDEVKEVIDNELVSKPDDPIKSGYRFNGWFTDLDYENLFDFNTPITSDIYLYPNFIKTYTVTFSSRFGEFEDLVVDENSTITLPNPSYTGYNFLGWYLNGVLFDSNSYITDDLILDAKWEEIVYNDDLVVTSYGGYNEGAFVEFNKISNYKYKSDYSIYYKKSNSTSYVKLDSNLIQENTTSIRADILGISSGTYDIKIEVGGSIKELTNITVTSYDRSGYAHFNSSGIGAYNDDGTPKNNAVIIYVTEATKNTVKATFNNKTYTGIGEILKNASKCSNPLIIRIIGTITAATWKPISYNGSVVVKDKNDNVITSTLDESEIISKGVNTLNVTDKITKLNGLTNKISYKSGEYDSVYNLLNISNAKNITIEGVGNNAMLFQWGLNFSNSSYIEVRNLTFDDYTEDACSFDGSDTNASNVSDFRNGRIWVHNNTFNEGINYWDVTFEQDKHEGDGATDFKGVAYVTISYNHYYKNHKTGLIGGSNSQTSACITFHHNFYEECSSRLPLGRQANMHMYNNYYYNITGTTMSIRAGGYAFIENCVFENCKNPMTTANDDSYGNGAIKSYNNSLINCSGTNNSVIVSNRTDSISNDNRYNKTFDTDSNFFYYDSINKKSNVLLLDTKDVKDHVIKYAGVLNSNFKSEDVIIDNNSGNNNVTDCSNIITFSTLSVGEITSNTSFNNVTIIPKSGKTCTVYECDVVLNNESITKYVSLGGAGAYDSLSIQFTTTNKANITVYFSSGGSSARYVKLLTNSDSIKSTVSTVPGDQNSIVSYTFENIDAGYLALASYNSGINIYCIVIEYIN